MKYKMLALDLDGTLTNEQKIVTERTKKALFAATKRGVKVVLASGRPEIGVWPVARNLKMDQIGGYILAYNGAVAIDCQTGEELFSDKPPLRMLKDICHLAKEYGVVPLNYDDKSVLTEQPDDVHVAREAYNNSLPITKVDCLADAVLTPRPKYMVVGDPKRLSACAQAIKARFGDECACLQPQPDFLDVVSPGVDKPKALERLGEIFGIRREEIMACGDGLNDISMLKYAGLGVAMANSYPETLAAADYVTASNDEDGVALAVEKFLLQE